MTWPLPEPMLIMAADSPALPPGWAAEPKIWTGLALSLVRGCGLRFGARQRHSMSGVSGLRKEAFASSCQETLRRAPRRHRPAIPAACTAAPWSAKYLATQR